MVLARLQQNKDEHICVHIMVFCKSFAEEHRTTTTVAPENNLESTHNHHQRYLSWLLHSACYSCCYFISIPMRIAAVGQHKAIKSPIPTPAVEKWWSDVFHPDRNITRCRSNAATATYRWTLGGLLSVCSASVKAEGNLLFYFCGGVIIIIFQQRTIKGGGWILVLKGKNSYPPAFLPLKGKNSYPGRVSFEG